MYLLEGQLKTSCAPSNVMNEVHKRVQSPFFSGRLQIVMEPSDVLFVWDSVHREWDVVARLNWRRPTISTIRVFSFERLDFALAKLAELIGEKLSLDEG